MLVPFLPFILLAPFAAVALYLSMRAADSMEYERFRYALGITSVWMAVPVCLGVGDWEPDWQADQAASTLRLLLLVAAVFAGIMSTVMCLPKGGATPGVTAVDRGAARGLFLLTAATHAGGYAEQRCTAMAPILIVLLYAASRYVQKYRPTDVFLRTVAHLCFRFTGFWWITWALTKPHAGLPLSVTVLYWTHAANAMWGPRAFARGRRGRGGSPFVAARWCARGCAEVAVLALGVVLRISLPG